MYIDFRLFLKKSVQKLQDEGPRAAVRGVPHLLVSFLRREQKAGAFDLKHNTDTGGRIPLWELEVDSPNAVHGMEYSPTDEQELLDAISFLREDLQNFTFVDLGCGKGRTLLVAANARFKHVIGVEFVPQLAAIARENLEKERISNATVLLTDAAEYCFPAGDLVVYLFNPFNKHVMQKVIANLRSQLSKKLYVIYLAPTCAPTLDASGFLARLGSPPGRPRIQIWKRHHMKRDCFGSGPEIIDAKVGGKRHTA